VSLQEKARDRHARVSEKQKRAQRAVEAREERREPAGPDIKVKGVRIARSNSDVMERRRAGTDSTNIGQRRGQDD
jgi:hypothetical protein